MSEGGYDLERLKTVGLGSILDLALARVERVRRAGYSGDEAVRVLSETGKMLGAYRGRDLLKLRNMQPIPTGCRAIDRLLSGGVKPGLVTDFFGESGVGKSQLCFQLALKVALASEAGGLGGYVAFMDTCGTFRPERLRGLASAWGVDLGDALARILVSKPRSVKAQTMIVDAVYQIEGLRLLLIDNLTENFLVEFGGDEGVMERQMLLGRHLHDLALLALKKDIAVVVTNSVRFRAAPAGSRVESGGSIPSQYTHVRIELLRVNRGFAARRLHPPPIIEASYGLSEAGVVDV